VPGRKHLPSGDLSSLRAGLLFVFLFVILGLTRSGDRRFETMLSARLVKAIEDNAEQLALGLLDDLQTNPRTTSYHKLSREEIRRRVYSVYRNLGNWLGRKSDDAIEAFYTHLGKTRCEEGVPLSQVVYSLIRTKNHLREYIRTSGLIGSAVDLYQQQELVLLLTNFFDLAIYYTAQGYERQAARSQQSARAAVNI